MPSGLYACSSYFVMVVFTLTIVCFLGGSSCLSTYSSKLKLPKKFMASKCLRFGIYVFSYIPFGFNRAYSQLIGCGLFLVLFLGRASLSWEGLEIMVFRFNFSYPRYESTGVSTKSG